MLDMYLATRFRFFTQHTSKSALATLGKLCEFHRKKAKRKKGETPKSLFYFSFRPLTKFPKADLGVWRSGSGSEIHFEHVQFDYSTAVCVHSVYIELRFPCICKTPTCYVRVLHMSRK